MAELQEETGPLFKEKEESEFEKQRAEMLRQKEFKERFANASHTDLLDIQSYSLPAVPPDTFQLVNIRRLYLQNNR